MSNNKIAAVAAYITWVGFIIAMLIGDRTDRFVNHHLNQAMVINITEHSRWSAGSTSAGRWHDRLVGFGGGVRILDHGHIQSSHGQHGTTAIYR